MLSVRGWLLIQELQIRAATKVLLTYAYQVRPSLIAIIQLEGGSYGKDVAACIREVVEVTGVSMLQQEAISNVVGLIIIMKRRCVKTKTIVLLCGFPFQRK
jgi:hypothetical protein